MSHRNRQHPANLEEPLKITVTPIENGDDCGYLVDARGHGGSQQQFADGKEAVLARIADVIEDWQAYCKERAETGKLERTIVDGPVDLPA